MITAVQSPSKCHPHESSCRENLTHGSCGCMRYIGNSLIYSEVIITYMSEDNNSVTLTLYWQYISHRCWFTTMWKQCFFFLMHRYRKERKHCIHTLPLRSWDPTSCSTLPAVWTHTVQRLLALCMLRSNSPKHRALQKALWVKTPSSPLGKTKLISHWKTATT